MESQTEITTQKVDSINLIDFFVINKKKKGYLYKNGIIIQDILIIKITTNDSFNNYFEQKHKIPIISDNINISSSDDILIVETNIPKNDNIIVDIDQNLTIKGLTPIVHHYDKYSTIFIHDNENTQHYIKTDKFSIKQDKTEEKEISFFLKFQNDIIKDKEYNISIYYTIPFDSLSNKEFWSFKHFLYVNNTQTISKIQETNHSLDTFKFDTKVYMEPLNISLDNIIFNELNISDKELVMNINTNSFVKIFNKDNDKEIKNVLESYTQETESQSLTSKRAPTAYKNENESSYINDSIEKFDGNIVLNNSKKIMLLYSKRDIKGKIYNYINVNTYIDYHPHMNLDAFSEHVSPITEIVFVENYFTNKGIKNISTRTPISPGIVTIYATNNSKDYENIINSNGNDVLLTSNTRNINLGRSKSLMVSSKILRVETENDYNNRWFLFRIKNTSSNRSIITLIFIDIDSINIVNFLKNNDNFIDNNKMINKGNINEEFKTNESKENKIFIDIPLNKNSVMDLVIKIRTKI
jgi:hypothetical protein